MAQRQLSVSHQLLENTLQQTELIARKTSAASNLHSLSTDSDTLHHGPGSSQKSSGRWKSAVSMVGAFNKLRKSVVKSEESVHSSKDDDLAESHGELKGPEKEKEHKFKPHQRTKLIRQDESVDSGYVDPVYLAIKNATMMYKKQTSPIESSNEDVRRKGSTNTRSTPSRSGTSSRKGSTSGVAESTSTPLLASLYEDTLRPPTKHQATSNHSNQYSTAGPSCSKATIPMLSEKMKSVSLDCPDNCRFAEVLPGNRLKPNRLRVKTPRIMKNVSIETSTGTDISDFSMSPCPSPNVHGSIPGFSNGVIYTVVHDFKATAVGEINLRVGQKLSAVETPTDSDQLYGCTVDELHLHGTFPIKCVATLNPGESLALVRVAVNLSDGARVLPLHRHQIVFALVESQDKVHVIIRTTSNQLAMCPIQYLQYY